jgi:hypothetical protein
MLLYAPLPKVFYSSMVYTFLNLLGLTSLLCLQPLCRCPLTIAFSLLGILSSSIIKLLPFGHLYSLVLVCSYPRSLAYILMYAYFHTLMTIQDILVDMTLTTLVS